MHRPTVTEDEADQHGERGEEVVGDLVAGLVVDDELDRRLEHGDAAHEEDDQEEEVRGRGVDAVVALHEDRNDDLREIKKGLF